MDHCDHVRTPRFSSGFGLLEVLIAMLIVVLVGLPLMQSGSSIHHHTVEMEFQVLAAVRARTVMSVLHAVDFERLHRAVGAGGLTTLDLGQLVAPDTITVLLSAPDVTYRGRIAQMSHDIQAGALDPDRVVLQVAVSYQIPGKTRATPHVYRLATVVHRPEATMSRAVPLR